MSWLRGFNLLQPAGNFIFAKFFGKNGQNLVTIKSGGVILLLRFAYEIMNPKIAIAFQRSPDLLCDPLEKKDVMEAGLSYDQVERSFRQFQEIQVGNFISEWQVLLFAISRATAIAFSETSIPWKFGTVLCVRARARTCPRHIQV